MTALVYPRYEVLVQPPNALLPELGLASDGRVTLATPCHDVHYHHLFNAFSRVRQLPNNPCRDTFDNPITIFQQLATNNHRGISEWEMAYILESTCKYPFSLVESICAHKRSFWRGRASSESTVEHTNGSVIITSQRF